MILLYCGTKEGQKMNIKKFKMYYNLLLLSNKRESSNEEQWEFFLKLQNNWR